MESLKYNINHFTIDSKKKSKKPRIGKFYFLGENETSKLDSQKKLKKGKSQLETFETFRLYFENNKKIHSDLEYYTQENIGFSHFQTDTFHPIKNSELYTALDYRERKCWIGLSQSKIDFVYNGGIRSLTLKNNETVLRMKAFRIEEIDTNIYFVLFTNGILKVLDGNGSINEELHLEKWNETYAILDQNYTQFANHVNNITSSPQKQLGKDTIDSLIKYRYDIQLQVSYTEKTGIQCQIILVYVNYEKLDISPFIDENLNGDTLTPLKIESINYSGVVSSFCKIVHYEFNINAFSESNIYPNEYLIPLIGKYNFLDNLNSLITRISITSDGTLLAIAIGNQNNSQKAQQLLFIDTKFQQCTFGIQEFNFLKENEYILNINWIGTDKCLLIVTNTNKWGLYPRFGTNFLRIQSNDIESSIDNQNILEQLYYDQVIDIQFMTQYPWNFVVFDGDSFHYYEIQWIYGNSLLDTATAITNLTSQSTQISKDSELIFEWKFISSFKLNSHLLILQKENLLNTLQKIINFIFNGNNVEIVKKFHDIEEKMLNFKSISEDLIEFTVKSFSRLLLDICIKKLIPSDICLNFLGSIQSSSHVDISETWSEYLNTYPFINSSSNEKNQIIDFLHASQISFTNYDYNFESQNRIVNLYESTLKGESTNTNNIKEWEIIYRFLEFIRLYKLEDAFSILTSQLGFDISLIQELIPTSKVLDSFTSNMLKAFISIICLNLQEKIAYIIPPILLNLNDNNNNYPIILTHPFLENTEINFQYSVYYTPLDSKKLRKAVIDFISQNDRSKYIKSFLINSWIVSGDLESAVSCSINFRMWNYLIKLNMLHFSKFNQFLLNDILFTSVNKFIKEKKFDYVKKILMIASVYQPNDVQSLQMHTAEQLIEQIQLILYKDTSVMNSQVIPLNFTHLLIEEMTEVNDMYSTKKSPSKSIESQLKQFNFTNENQEVNPLIRLFVDCLNLFSNGNVKLIKLFSIYSSMHKSKKITNEITKNHPNQLIQLSPFKKILQLIWYAHLKSSIVEHVEKLSEFRHIYSPKNSKSEDHDALLATIAHKLIFLSQFKNIHSVNDIQGSILTVISMIHSETIIKDLIISSFPTEESVIPTLRFKQDQIYSKIKKINPNLYLQLVDDLKKNLEKVQEGTFEDHLIENNSEYWNFFDNLFHLLTSDEIITHNMEQSILQLAAIQSYVLNTSLGTSDKMYHKNLDQSIDDWDKGDSIYISKKNTTLSPSKVMSYDYESEDLNESLDDLNENINNNARRAWEEDQKQSKNESSNQPRLFKLKPMDRSAILAKYGKKNHHVTFSNEPKIFNIEPRGFKRQGFTRLEDFENQTPDKVKFFRIPILHNQTVPDFVKQNKNVLNARKSLSPNTSDHPKVLIARPRDSLIEQFNESLTRKKNRDSVEKKQINYQNIIKESLELSPEKYKSNDSYKNEIPTKDMIEQMFEKFSQQITHQIDQKLKLPTDDKEESKEVSKLQVATVLLDKDDDSYMKKKAQTNSKSFSSKKISVKEANKAISNNKDKKKEKNENERKHINRKDKHSKHFTKINEHEEFPVHISSQEQKISTPTNKKLKSPKKNITSKNNKDKNYIIYESHQFESKDTKRNKSPISTNLSDISNDDVSEFKDDTSFSEHKSEIQENQESFLDDNHSTLSAISISKLKFSNDDKEERYRQHLRELGHEPNLRKISRLLPVVSTFDKLKQEVLQSPNRMNQNTFGISGYNPTEFRSRYISHNTNFTNSILNANNPTSSNINLVDTESRSTRVFHPQPDEKEETLRKKLDIFMQTKHIPKSPQRQFTIQTPTSLHSNNLRSNIHMPIPIHDIPEDDLDFEIHPDIKRILNRGDDLLGEFSNLQKEMDEAQSLIKNLNF